MLNKYYKQGDGAPALQLRVLSSVTRRPLDFTGCTVFFNMTRINPDGTETAVIENGVGSQSDSILSYSWGESDLDVTGEYIGVFTVFYNEGAGPPKSYPTKGVIRIFVESL